MTFISVLAVAFVTLPLQEAYTFTPTVGNPLRYHQQQCRHGPFFSKNHHQQQQHCKYRSSSSLINNVVRLYGNSENIRAAMEATEMYGIHSPQAKLLWEVVEEYDGRDNSAAYEPDRNRMLSPDQLQAAYDELQHTLDVLQRQRPRTFDHDPDLMKDIAAELQSIKLAPPDGRPAPKIPGLWDAKLKARAMSQQHGNDSVEAKLAWEEVEEIASAGLDNAIGQTYETATCDLGQAAEACLALEELDRFLYFDHQYKTAAANDDYQHHQVVDDGYHHPQDRHGVGGSDEYVGGYFSDVDYDNNGGQWDDSYVDEINNGNYQDWNNYNDDGGRSGGDGGGRSNFDDRRSSHTQQY